MKFKTFITVIVTVLYLSLLSEEKKVKIPERIDSLTKKIPVIFNNLHDPSTIVLAYVDSNKKIETVYEADKNFEILSEWLSIQKKTQTKREMYISYSFENGTELIDAESKKQFKLPGYMSYHPIDDAYNKLNHIAYSTYDMIKTQKLQREAWEKEVERIYDFLGGDRNESLKEMQSKWQNYKETRVKFLQDFYFNKQGSMYGLIYAEKLTEIYKEQAKFLQGLLKI